jgi:hypothetical protein
MARSGDSRSKTSASCDSAAAEGFRHTSSLPISHRRVLPLLRQRPFGWCLVTLHDVAPARVPLQGGEPGALGSSTDPPGAIVVDDIPYRWEPGVVLVVPDAVEAFVDGVRTWTNEAALVADLVAESLPPYGRPRGAGSSLWPRPWWSPPTAPRPPDEVAERAAALRDLL